MAQNQNQPQVGYPYPTPAFDAAYAAPPPPGYPTKDDGMPQNNNTVPIETNSRGDGFWKGCCAALCCCCVLDACF